jgi:hypothetical protein
MTRLGPISKDFTTSVATQTFVRVDDRGSIQVQVELGTPVQDIETVQGADWRCPIRFSEEGEMHVVSVCGASGLQSLALALKLIEAEFPLELQATHLLQDRPV